MENPQNQATEIWYTKAPFTLQYMVLADVSARLLEMKPVLLIHPDESKLLPISDAKVISTSDSTQAENASDRDWSSDVCSSDLSARTIYCKVNGALVYQISVAWFCGFSIALVKILLTLDRKSVV